MSKIKPSAVEFEWVGQLLDFIIKDGYKIKYLRLNVAEREYWVKVPKSLRAELDPAIRPGSQLAVSGWASRCTKTGKLKLKAESIRLIGGFETSEAGIAPAPAEAPAKLAKQKPAKVLVCTKSSCRKRGADAICAALRERLQAQGLTGRVEIKTTGCLKACKQGPNVVVMPGKVRYSGIASERVVASIAKYFDTNAASQTEAKVSKIDSEMNLV